MDIVSIFISIVLVAFFLSNYLHKYKEENVKDFTKVYVFSGFVLECLIILSFILNNALMLYILLIIFFLLFVIVFIKGLIKVNKLKKEGKSNRECIIFGLRDVMYVLASLLLIIQYSIYWVYKKLFIK